ncbi:MAG TPA: hypothetical protein VN370_03165 [Desulfitobacteriaceae bacterium]|nr:hypothetical protein [Desulfitobacteriaceae bacterium]
MITIESMMSIDKGDLQEAAKRLSKDDIPQLVEWLSLKDDKIRYQAFLLLQNRSVFFDDVYPYWETFCDKLKNANSYQRSIGLMLVAENTKWDQENRIENAIDEYLELLNDEKPVTIRQCIQSLAKIAAIKPGLNNKIADRLISFNLMAIKETMRKSILLDSLNVLLIIRKKLRKDEIESFILKALSGEVLDKKAKKQIEALL